MQYIINTYVGRLSVYLRTYVYTNACVYIYIYIWIYQHTYRYLHVACPNKHLDLFFSPKSRSSITSFPTVQLARCGPTGRGGNQLLHQMGSNPETEWPESFIHISYNMCIYIYISICLRVYIYIYTYIKTSVGLFVCGHVRAISKIYKAISKISKAISQTHSKNCKINELVSPHTEIWSHQSAAFFYPIPPGKSTRISLQNTVFGL